MTLKTILFGAASALVLSASAANAVPATAETSLNVRSGPGTEYEVVGTIPDGGTVDVRGCTGGWCRVSFSGGSGYASRNYLAMAGGAGPAVGVAVTPGYAYYDGPYYDDYYDYGYGYGPSVGFSVGVGGRFHRGWHGGNWDRGHAWNGGGRNWNGGGHNWSGRPGQNHAGSVASRQGGFAGPPAGWQRPGTGIGGGGRAGGGMAGASVGMRGGSGGAPAGAGGHVGGGAPGGGGAGGGFAGSIAKH